MVHGHSFGSAVLRWTFLFLLLITTIRRLGANAEEANKSLGGKPEALADLKALIDEIEDDVDEKEALGTPDVIELGTHDDIDLGTHDDIDLGTTEGTEGDIDEYMELYYDADDDFYIPQDSADLRQFASSDLFTVQIFPKRTACFYIDIDGGEGVDVTGAFLVVENVPIDVKVIVEKNNPEVQKSKFPPVDILWSEITQEGNIILKDPPPGALKICLTNTHHDDKLKCQFAFREGRGSEASRLKKDDLFEIRSSIKRLHNRLNAIDTEQSILSMRIISHYELQVSNDSEVSVSALLESMVYIFVCVRQVYYITNLVETRQKASTWA